MSGLAAVGSGAVSAVYYPSTGSTGSLGGASGITQGTPGEGALTGGAGAMAGVSTQALSYSATSMSATMESFTLDYGSAGANKELLGAILLLLVLEYMQSDDAKEKQGLLGLMLALTQQGQQGEGGQISYSAMSISMQSEQLQMISTDMVTAAYSGGAAGGSAGTGARIELSA